MVLGLQCPFSAMYTKMQEELVFGKEVLPSCHWEYNAYQGISGLCLHGIYSLVKEKQ